MLVFRRNMVTATLYQICTHRHTHHDCRHIARSVLGTNIMTMCPLTRTVLTSLCRGTGLVLGSLVLTDSRAYTPARRGSGRLARYDFLLVFHGSRTNCCRGITHQSVLVIAKKNKNNAAEHPVSRLRSARRRKNATYSTQRVCLPTCSVHHHRHIYLPRQN